MPSARRVSWAKFRVTVVSLVGLLILSTLVYLLTGGTLFREKATVYIYIPDATGLQKGAPVRVDGIGVGQVASVSLSGSNDPNRVVRVVLSIYRDRLSALSADCYAQLASDSLIGDKYIDITSGKNPAHIQPGAELTFKNQTDFIKNIDLTQFEVQLRSIDATLAEIESGRSQVGQLVLTDDLYNSIKKTFSQLDQGLRAAASTTSSFGQALYSDTVYRKIADYLATFDQLLARLQSGQGAGGQFLRDPAQYVQMRGYAADLRKSIADLRASEFMTSTGQYEGWSRNVSSLIQRVDEVNANPLFSSSEMYDNLSGAMKEFQIGLKDFREDPRRFMRLKIF
jgi:phospholipid/cholesterol/gamma-HCH transport system substrate-binding protein